MDAGAAEGRPRGRKGADFNQGRCRHSEKTSPLISGCCVVGWCVCGAHFDHGPLVSGFDRLWVVSFPAVPIADTKRYLCESTALDNAQVEQVLDVVGNHMGDLSDIAATFIDQDKSFTDRHLNGTAPALCCLSSPVVYVALVLNFRPFHQWW